jgi:glutamate racemase
MIWVFDSGMGGRVVLDQLVELLPEYDYLYLWDTKYLPYWEKTPQFLKERTFACLQWMFDQWCELIILACNTASAYAIRPRQEQFPDKKVLSVTVPWVEKVIELWAHKPVLFATQATIASNIYPSVTRRISPEYAIQYVPLVWKWIVDRLEQRIGTYELVQNLFGTVRNEDYDAVVLWCTHYPLITDQVQEIIWKRIPIIDPGYESVVKLRDYLSRHQEMQPSRWWTVRKVVTGVGSEELTSITLSL